MENVTIIYLRKRVEMDIDPAAAPAKNEFIKGYVKTGFGILASLQKYLPPGTSFNNFFLPRVVESLSDGNAKYLPRLPK